MTKINNKFQVFLSFITRTKKLQMVAGPLLLQFEIDKY